VILRGFRIENWRCIRKLELADLGPGVVVLHGPNRTGKSSLVLALRAGLFDCDHNSTERAIKDSLPWDGSGPPKVVVEFSTGGTDYRITKVFAKTKEGTALLEKKSGSAYSVIEAAPKEASRRVRELLGADKSTAGLNQLLWLSQGEVNLPQAKKLDVSLQQRLVGVLGMMVEGRDFSFKEELDRRYGKWFTPQTGNYKKDCTVLLLDKEKQDREKVRNDEKDKLKAYETAIGQLQGAEDDLPQKKRDVKDAETELEQLEQERKRGEDRVRKFREAEQGVKDATERLTGAQKNLAEYQAAKDRLQIAETKVRVAQESLRGAQEQRDRLAAEHQAKTDKFVAARQREKMQRGLGDDLEDRRQLLALHQRHEQLESDLETAGEKEKEIADLEGRLKAVSVPDQVTLRQLRDKRTKLVSLQAQLQASALSLSIAPKKPVRIYLALDGQPAQLVELEGDSKATWTLQHRVELTLPDGGTIELSRAAKDLDFESASHELASITRDYRETVLSFQENPDDEECLDRLAESLHKSNGWTARLAAVRSELAKVAPKGQGVLEREVADAGQQCKIIMERRPDLTDWLPTTLDVDERQKQYTAQRAEIDAERSACEEGERKAAGELAKANEALNERKGELSAAKATEVAARDDLARRGDEKELQTSVEQAKAALAAAEQLFAAAQLTQEEKLIDQRCQQAAAALKERRYRLRAVEDQLTTLRGFLSGNEGLHRRLADAEAAVLETERALARERLEAAAHKQLRDLFDQCRESQIQQVMGPVAGRVLEWSKSIGLTEYEEMRFGDQFLPEGIVLQSRGPEAPVALDEESYGTFEQLGLLVRLALGGILAKDEPAVAVLDDPLAHSSDDKHRRILDVLRLAAEGNASAVPPAGRLQIIILTCHPKRFDHLPGARHIDLGQVIEKG
jgi:hypothetical protein